MTGGVGEPDRRQITNANDVELDRPAVGLGAVFEDRDIATGEDCVVRHFQALGARSRAKLRLEGLGLWRGRFLRVGLPRNEGDDRHGDGRRDEEPRARQPEVKSG